MYHSVEVKDRFSTLVYDRAFDTHGPAHAHAHAIRDRYPPPKYHIDVMSKYR